MKKALLIAMVITLVAAGAAMATVVGSKHDMTTRISDAGTTQVCVYCHHPHVGTGSQQDLLWNFSDGTNSFQTYGGTATLANAADTGDALGTTGDALFSMYCMACHDGATSSDALYAQPGDGSAGTLGEIGTGMGTEANLGSTLEDDHPVDFDYTYVAAQDSGIQANSAGDGDDVQGASSSVIYPIYNNTMQCATCHNVHDGTTSETVNGIQFMRGDGTAVISGSTICVDCHINK